MKTSSWNASSAEERAALWAARLDGDTLDRDQRVELDAWLAEDPRHRHLLSQYCQLSADLEETIPALVGSGGLAMPKPSDASARRRWSFPRVAGIALAAAAAIAVTVHFARPAPEVQNVATSPAQRSTETLADGTRVELNAQTSLRFENTKHERRARLAGGEALFIVATDPKRPFIVETTAGTVRVTGTTFNVRTEPAAVMFEVTVVEGSVQVRPNESGQHGEAKAYALGARDQFSARGDQVATRPLSPSEVEETLAWREGHVVFHGTPVAEALARYARHHGRNISAAPAIAKAPISGFYSIDDLTGFLKGLESILAVKANYDPHTGAITVAPPSR